MSDPTTSSLTSTKRLSALPRREEGRALFSAAAVLAMGVAAKETDPAKSTVAYHASQFVTVAGQRDHATPHAAEALPFDTLA